MTNDGGNQWYTMFRGKKIPVEPSVIPSPSVKRPKDMPWGPDCLFEQRRRAELEKSAQRSAKAERKAVQAVKRAKRVKQRKLRNIAVNAKKRKSPRQSMKAKKADPSTRRPMKSFLRGGCSDFQRPPGIPDKTFDSDITTGLSLHGVENMNHQSDEHEKFLKDCFGVVEAALSSGKSGRTNLMKHLLKQKIPTVEQKIARDSQGTIIQKYRHAVWLYVLSRMVEAKRAYIEYGQRNLQNYCLQPLRSGTVPPDTETRRTREVPATPKTAGGDKIMTEVTETLKKEGYDVRGDIRGDGNCQFRCVAEVVAGGQGHHGSVRKKVVQRIKDNKDSLQESILEMFGRDVELTDEWISGIESGEWGDFVTLFAAAKLYDCQFIVHGTSEGYCRIPKGNEDGTKTEVHLAYYHDRHYDLAIKRDIAATKIRVDQEHGSVSSDDQRKFNTPSASSKEDTDTFNITPLMKALDTTTTPRTPERNALSILQDTITDIQQKQKAQMLSAAEASKPLTVNELEATFKKIINEFGQALFEVDQERNRGLVCQLEQKIAETADTYDAEALGLPNYDKFLVDLESKFLVEENTRREEAQKQNEHFQYVIKTVVTSEMNIFKEMLKESFMLAQHNASDWDPATEIGRNLTGGAMDIDSPNIEIEEVDSVSPKMRDMQAEIERLRKELANKEYLHEHKMYSLQNQNQNAILEQQQLLLRAAAAVLLQRSSSTGNGCLSTGTKRKLAGTHCK
mmetsp:Transcript_13702/g.54152  ORF Transcript_13702/g.54152 Transcript_13702/m.54152 type:complete len:735 (-) Transcript_13702:768-2972(-)